ncbi:MAG TPA: lysylphosphatidylglycerol synthase domain-containing protein [Casimicrobiaceae bacterium]|jgi:putative membrane protein
MRRPGTLLAVAGLLFAAFLFWQEDLGAIASLLAGAGAGLVVAGLVHVLPMALNTIAWHRLFAPRTRISSRRLLWATWARESVNGLLPVMRIGGEIVAYRVVRGGSHDGAEVAATLIVDVAMSMLTQAAFTVLGLALLLLHGVPLALAAQVAIAGAVLVALGAAFVAVQRAGIAGGAARLLDRFVAGRLERAIAGSERVDVAIAHVYARRSGVAKCAAWQLLGWIAGAAEIWLALHFIGQPRSFVDAIVIEAIVQAVSSVAFVVPGALGVQEGAFLLLGAAVGLDGSSALALAAARRVRDLVVFFPGLAAWHWAEARLAHDARRASRSS